MQNIHMYYRKMSLNYKRKALYKLSKERSQIKIYVEAIRGKGVESGDPLFKSALSRSPPLLLADFFNACIRRAEMFCELFTKCQRIL